MCNARCACGSAMFTIEASKMIISCATPMTASASHRRSRPRGGAGAGGRGGGGGGGGARGAGGGGRVECRGGHGVLPCVVRAIPCEQPVGGLRWRHKRKQPPLNLPEAPSVLSTDLAEEISAGRGGAMVRAPRADACRNRDRLLDVAST